MGPSLVWNIRLITERDEGQRVTRGRAVDIAAHAIDPKACNFLVVLSPGHYLLPHTLSSIDHAVNEKMDRFVLLEFPRHPADYMVFYRLFKQFGGEREAELSGTDDNTIVVCHNIIEKIKASVIYDGCPTLVRDAEEVCGQPS